MRPVIALTVYLLPAGLMIWSIVRLFRNRGESFLYRWQQGLGWISLCTLPFPFVQLIRGVIREGGITSDLLESLAVLPGTWYMLFGGQTVVSVFEENVKDWTGHRRDTMLDNAPVFFGMVLVQVLVLSFLAGWRFHRGKRLRDPLVLAIGAFFAINAALAMDWPWYGT